MKRTERLINQFKKEKLDGLLLTHAPNIRYMTGYTGTDAFAVLSANGCVFFTDYRFFEQGQSECDRDFEVIRYRAPDPSFTETVAAICERLNIKRLGFEKAFISYEVYEQLKSEVGGVRLVATKGLVEGLRYVKDDLEIAHLKEAFRITDRTFDHMLNFIRPGVSERELDLEMVTALRRYGAEDCAFPNIIAGGYRTSLPHAIPNDRPLEKGDFVILDFGAMYQGYRADMTRTVILGEPSAQQLEVYSVVRQAQEAALEGMRAGKPGYLPDQISRMIIEDAGYGEFAGAGLGHGVGLMLHEEPFMSPSCQRNLESGSVVTVEPGIYIPGWGGVRIEDTVIVGEDHCEILTKTTKDLIVIPA